MLRTRLMRKVEAGDADAGVEKRPRARCEAAGSEARHHAAAEACQPLRRLRAEVQRRRAHAHAHVVRRVLVRVDGVIHKRPAHASRVQRAHNRQVQLAARRRPALRK